MRGEVEKTLMLYLPEENNTVHYHGDNDQVLMLQEFVEHGKFFPCDGPDCYITLNGNLLIIEHFQFTCSKKTKKVMCKIWNWPELIGTGMVYHITRRLNFLQAEITI